VANFTESVDFVVISTWCGHTMAIRKALRDWAYYDGNRKFYCAECGKVQVYGYGERQRLEHENKRLEQERNRARNQAAAERRSKNAIKGHHTRTKKRVAAGVCPCCNRSFENLGRHMKHQHPDYLEADGS